jgi:hypothetical protein
MKQIIIKTQRELDNLPDKFEEPTKIIIQNDPRQGSIDVRGARGNSSVEAWDHSSVVAWNNSSVKACGNSSVEAWNNSSVEACGNSSVEAWDHSSVVAWNNSSVKACGNSSVEAWDHSSVEAWDNSFVKAWGNSSVEAWGNVGVRLQSDNATVMLYMFAVCWVKSKGKVMKKASTATIVKPKKLPGVAGWLADNAVKKSASSVVLFKRVSSDFKTQEGTSNETIWALGKTLEHPAWAPSGSECGAGKFHACSRPHFCDEFRSVKDDKYIAIKIQVKDLYAWTGDVQYPHKIAFRKGKVLYVCDSNGKKIDA